MKTLNTVVIFLAISLTTLVSCKKEKRDANENLQNNLIKSEVSGDKAVSQYIYNSTGRIAEIQGFDRYTRYLYDSNGRLAKSESATNQMYSAIASSRTEFMTSQNSVITSYQIFEYNQTGRLEKVKNYFKEKDEFKLTSTITFDYEGKNIIKKYMHNAGGAVTHFNNYEYDSRGNVVSEKYYTNFEHPAPKLISETSFKHDNKNNPLKILEASGYPGLFTNSNNIIETNLSKTRYEYNGKGFPVKVISDNSIYEYRYH